MLKCLLWIVWGEAGKLFFPFSGLLFWTHCSFLRAYAGVFDRHNVETALGDLQHVLKFRRGGIHQIRTSWAGFKKSALRHL